jgi:hypothetical protein
MLLLKERPSDTALKVKIVHCFNRLKHKISPGQQRDVYIAQDQLDRANRVWEDYHKRQDSVMLELTEGLYVVWDRIKKSPDKQCQYLRILFLMYMNRVFDIAALFQNEVMLHFIRSLKQFTAISDFNDDKHRAILQAHLDTINLARHQKLVSTSDGKARDLMQLLETAIRQNS